MNYKILHHLPTIPDDILQSSIRNININSLEYFNNNIGRPVELMYKKYPRISLDAQCEAWCRENIVNDAIEYAISVSSEDNNTTSLRPHTDRNRNYTLQYLLKSGGEHHKTVFYKHRDESFLLTRCQSFDYDELIALEEVSIPVHCWTIINSQIIHSVENIPSVRMALQISLDNNPWETL